MFDVVSEHTSHVISSISTDDYAYSIKALRGAVCKKFGASPKNDGYMVMHYHVIAKAVGYVDEDYHPSRNDISRYITSIITSENDIKDICASSLVCLGDIRAQLTKLRSDRGDDVSGVIRKKINYLSCAATFTRHMTDKLCGVVCDRTMERYRCCKALYNFNGPEQKTAVAEGYIGIFKNELNYF